MPPVRLRRRSAVVTIAATLAVLALGAAAVRSATAPTHVMTFVDERRGLSLSIELEPSASDAGHFVFRVAGRGAYTATAGSAMRALTPTSVVVHYEGPAQLRRSGGAGPSVPHTVRVSLQAQIDPAHHTAQATLTHGAARFHLVVAAIGRGDLEPTLRAFEAAAANDDGAAIYELLSSDYTSRQTRDAFAQQWAEQSAQNGRLTALRRTATSDVSTSDLGMTTVTASYSADARLPGGVTQTVSFDAVFLRQGDAWRLWFTSEPR